MKRRLSAGDFSVLVERFHSRVAGHPYRALRDSSFFGTLWDAWCENYPGNSTSFDCN
eukprot:COSAG02_NODE_66594_length_255_cov_0.647436_1_plen_56_part_10